MDKKKLITSLIFIIIVGVIITSLTVSKKSYAVGTTLVDTVKALSSGSSWSAGASGVYYTNNHEYRYIGAEVNNYVSFNNDLYRIIGVFDSNSHGVSGTEMVKLIRARTLGGASWGVYNTDSSTGTCSGDANDWTGKSTTSKANLNVLLNEYFYNKTSTSSTYGSCSNWTYYASLYTLDTNYRTNDCSDIVGYGIDPKYSGYIENATWYLYGSGTNQSKQNWYLCERGGNSCTTSGPNTGDASVTSKMGLMYLSDYLYASGYYSSTDTTTQGADYYSNKNWLYKGYEWTQTPYASDANRVWLVGSGSAAIILVLVSLLHKQIIVMVIRTGYIKDLSGHRRLPPPVRVVRGAWSLATRNLTSRTLCLDGAPPSI